MNATDDVRARLGIRLVFWATWAVVSLGIVVLIAAYRLGPMEFRDASQLLLSSLLPLLGTWVGTVLAFYFTKENFEAASKGTLDLVRGISEKLSKTRVADKMMPRSAIIAESVPADKKLGDLAIKAIEDRFTVIGANGRRISRLLIVNQADACLAILHRSILSEMLAAGLREKPPVDPATDLLSKLVGLKYPPPAPPAVSTYEDFITKTVAFVSVDGTVADAKAAMESVQGCQDVIVTKTGKAGEPMLGWISNVDISRLLNV